MTILLPRIVFFFKKLWSGLKQLYQLNMSLHQLNTSRHNLNACLKDWNDAYIHIKTNSSNQLMVKQWFAFFQILIEQDRFVFFKHKKIKYPIYVNISFQMLAMPKIHLLSKSRTYRRLIWVVYRCFSPYLTTLQIGQNNKSRIG